MKKFLLLLACVMLFTTNVDAQRKSNSSRRSSTTKTTKSKTNKQAGTPTILSYADKWKDKAKAGDANAQFELASCYYSNIGVKNDYAEAMKWALRAAEQGQPEAMELVGRMYQEGQGVDKDSDKAKEWFWKAYKTAIIRPDDARALYTIGILFQNGRGVELQKLLAIRYYTEAAELNYSNAMYELAYMYYNHEGTPTDYAKANKWYRRAAELGHPQAMNNLGWSYAHGNCGVQDYYECMEEASKWYRKAAELGNPNAMENLSLLYYNQALGLPYNDSLNEAEKWMRKSAELGRRGAIEWLAKNSSSNSSLERDTYKNFAGVWRCKNSYTQYKFDSNGNGWFRNGSGRAWESLGVTYKSYNCISVYDAHARHTLEISGSTMTQDNSYVYRKQ